MISLLYNQATRKLFLWLIFVVCLFALNAHAQSKSSLQVTVVDKANASLQQAITTLKTERGELVKEISNYVNQDIIFSSLMEGIYILEIQSPGFRSYSRPIQIIQGENSIKVTLEIEEIKVEVKVSQEDNEKSLNEAFSGNLTQTQIESLPSNPQDVEEELKRRYGDDVIIEINGFTGGQMPPKEQIESIKVIRSVFDSEFHEIGKTVVRIKTKGGAAKLFGFVNFILNDSTFNARNALTFSRLPERNKIFIGFLGFPLVKDKTSLILSMVNINNYRNNNIIAIVPDRKIENQLRTSFSIFTPTIAVDHTFSDNHSSTLSYGIEKIDFNNMGVGQFNLPERGYSNKINNHRIRFSESRVINKTYVNEFRVEILDSKILLTPNSSETAINVSGAFNAGGAAINNDSQQRKLYATDNILFDRAKQSLKIGGEIEFEARKTFTADNVNGSYVFTSLTDFQNGRPATFTQRQGTSVTSLQQAQIAFYVQNDIRLYRNFQISFGTRYEWQNNMRDYNNLSPRLSFVYSPSKEGKIVFRLGTGIFYQWLETQNLTNILSNDGRQASTLIVRNPGYPNPFSGGIISQSLPPSIFRKADNLVNPSIFITQAGFNYRAAKKLNIEAFYTFRRGNHQFLSRDINAPRDGIRPDTSLGRIAQVESSGTLNENSLEVKLDGSLLKGIPFNLRYMLAKSINDFDGIFDLPVNNYNRNLERGFSDLDQRHRLTGSINLLLLKKVRVTSIFRLASPLPYTITTGQDNNSDTVFNDRPVGARRNGERGTWFRQVDLKLGWSIPIAKSGAAKDSTANQTSDDKIAGSSIFKKRSLGVDITVQNLFNQTNLRNFIGNQLSPFYRQATVAAPARRIQIGLSFFF